METVNIDKGLTLKAVKEQFENWRNHRSGRQEPIPQTLWYAAAELCRTHGITHVSRALRLSYAELKKRVPTKEPSCATPQFMELDVNSFACQWHLECARSDGAKLRMSGNGRLPDVESMLGVFLS